MSTLKYSNENQDLRQLAPKLDAMPKYGLEETFKIPAGYFEKMQEEVLMHPFVNACSSFEVPDLYFENLPTQITNHALITKNNPFAVPQNYFDLVADKVAQKAGLSTVKTNMEVPEGYFENLPIKIQDRLYKEKKETKVFMLPLRPQFRMVLAAAMIVMLLIMVFYLRIFENPTANNTQLALSKINITETIEGNNLQDFDESMLIEAIDEPEQIDISSSSKPQKINTEITEYLIENDITLEDIAEEI
jgi:hypothetical protein